jgi:hypothetical protein
VLHTHTVHVYQCVHEHLCTCAVSALCMSVHYCVGHLCVQPCTSSRCAMHVSVCAVPCVYMCDVYTCVTVGMSVPMWAGTHRHMHIWVPASVGVVDM